MNKITPHLWFDTEALEAAEYYCSVFDDSKITSVNHYGEGTPGETGEVMQVQFEIEGQPVIALNGGPHFKLNESFSFFVNCDSQEEVDEYWKRLTDDGGEESQCGWLKDKFGLSWQIIPKLLGELAQDPDPRKSAAVIAAMLQMRKIECSELQRAYDQA